MMEHKYLLGSKMLKLNNNRDEDWVTFVEKHNPEKRIKGHRRIPFFKMMMERFLGGEVHPDSMYHSCFFFQLSCGFFEGDENYPFKDFNLLEHKDVWIKQLKGYMNHPKTEKLAFSKETLDKTFYHILYQYHMIVEDTHWISDEAKVDVQKIHDLEMPSSYFYELRDKINSL
jgi:hypothetical protein